MRYRILLVVFLCAFLTGCNDAKAQPPAPPVPVPAPKPVPPPVPTQPPPPTPTPVPPKAHSVTLRWAPIAAPNVSGYRVYRQLGGSAQLELEAIADTDAVENPIYVDSTVQAGATYTYGVAGLDNNKQPGTMIYRQVTVPTP